MMQPHSRRRGFTAIEIVMVASIIAIIALLILPIFRERVEEARRVAALDELQSLAKALLLVEIDVPGVAPFAPFTPQLSDLDNRSNTTLLTNDNPAIEPSRVAWRRGSSDIDPGRFEVIPFDTWRLTVVPNWNGPYIAMRNTITLLELEAAFPQLARRAADAPIAPILIPDFPNNNAAVDRYPLDPWGRPYLLFGSDETIYNTRVLYSLGPNGVPGNNPAPAPADFNRRNGVLGTGDDFEFIF